MSIQDSRLTEEHSDTGCAKELLAILLDSAFTTVVQMAILTRTKKWPVYGYELMTVQ